MRLFSEKYLKYVMILIAVILVFIVFLLWQPITVSSGSADYSHSYQYKVILDAGNANPFFYDAFISGARQASSECNVLLEIFDSNSSVNPEDRDLIGKSIYSNADGLILTDYSLSAQDIALLEKSSYSLMFVNTENSTLPDASYVGPDYKLLGQTLINEVISADSEEKQIALILSETMASEGSLINQGIEETLREYNNIDVLETVYVSSDILDTTIQSRELLQSYPDLDCIIGANETILTGIAETIVDLNRVSDVSAAGIGYSKTIQYYLDLGIIRTAIDVNPYQLGYQAILLLCDNLQNGNSSDTRIYTEVTTYKSTGSNS